MLVNLRRDRKTGQLVGKPEIISKGFVFVRDAEELMAAAREKIAAVAARSNGGLAQRVEDALADYFYNEMKRRPMIFATITEV
jgi:ribonuclease J